MAADSQDAPRPLPARPNLRHLKDQAKDLLKTGGAQSVTDAQFKIARLYGFASWPKLKAHVDSLEEIGQLKQAIDTNNIERVKTLMTRNPALHRAPLGYAKNGPLTWVAECRVPWAPPGQERLAIARWNDRKRIGRASGRRRAVDAGCPQRPAYSHDGTPRVLRCGRERGVERGFPHHLRALRGSGSCGSQMALGPRGKSELRQRGRAGHCARLRHRLVRTFATAWPMHRYRSRGRRCHQVQRACCARPAAWPARSPCGAH